ncbi:hypothetical protein, partial [Luteimonas salinilitoris]
MARVGEKRGQSHFSEEDAGSIQDLDPKNDSDPFFRSNDVRRLFDSLFPILDSRLFRLFRG